MNKALYSDLIIVIELLNSTESNAPNNNKILTELKSVTVLAPSRLLRIKFPEFLNNLQYALQEQSMPFGHPSCKIYSPKVSVITVKFHFRR